MKNAWINLVRGAGLIILLTLLAYLPALRGGFIWDDHNNITDNQLLRTWAGLEKTWTDTQASFQYYPLSYTGFWVEYNLWGTHAVGYHVVNVLLHALNAVLIGLLLSRLGVPGAWLAALLFAVHPVHVESVAWITELKNVLSGFFFLSALLAFLRFHQQAERRWWFYALSLLLFVCALLSKTSTVALPGAILLVIWWKQERVKERDLLHVLPFFLIGGALALQTVWLEKHYVRAEGPEWQLSLVERWLVAGRVVWFAAGKFIWPNPLIFVYPRWRVDTGVWWQYLFPLATVCVLMILWFLRKRLGKGPLTAALFFVGTTAPVPAAFDLYYMRYSYVADHFYYLASIGFIALAGTILSKALLTKESLFAVALPIVAVLSALSWEHCIVFRNEQTLWRDTVTKNPNAWMAHYNLGNCLSQAGRIQEAILHYEQALRIKPDYAEARYNLGNAFWETGRIQEAIAYYEQALRLKPDSAEAHNNMGVALVRLGKAQEAIGHWEQSLRIKPGFAEAHHNLGVALMQLGRVQEAIGHYQQALRSKPDYAEAHNNLGAALMQVGKLDDAIRHYERALRIKPDDAEAHNNLGNILLQSGRIADAIGHYEQALRIKPDDAEAHNNLGAALGQVGKLEDAIGHCEQALRIKPNYAEAHYNLGVALVRLSRTPEAIEHWEQALRIKPDYPEAHYNLGVALEQAGKVQEAIRHYEQALRIRPDFVEAQNKLARLRAAQ